MTNRKVAYILKDQVPIMVGRDLPARVACRLMADRFTGSVLVVDAGQRLVGIFTGRDALRMVARGLDSEVTPVGQVMTADPVTISPDQTSIEALRLMWDGGFRHLPVVEDGRIWGVVSRSDFCGLELDRLDHERHLWETIR